MKFQQVCGYEPKFSRIEQEKSHYKGLAQHRFNYTINFYTHLYTQDDMPALRTIVTEELLTGVLL